MGKPRGRESRLFWNLTSYFVSHNYAVPRLIEPVVPPGSLKHAPQPNLDVDEHSYLRPWKLEDTSTVVAAYSDPEIRKWIPYSFDADEAKEVIEKWIDTWPDETGAYWALAKKSDHSAFGRFAVRLAFGVSFPRFPIHFDVRSAWLCASI